MTDQTHPTVFGLDYDNTTARDIELWLTFVNLARARGHKVYLVTMRYPSELLPRPGNSKFHPVDGRILSAVDAVYPTSRQAKRDFLEQHGIKVTVWIDDEPRTINEHAHQIWPDVTPEGEVRHLEER